MVRNILFLLPLILLLNNCAPMIKGVKNTNLYNTPKHGSSFSLIYVSGDQILAPKMERMLHYQLKKLGFVRAEQQTPDVKILYAFDVVPAGAISTAYSFIYQPPQTATIVGNTITTNPTTAIATTSNIRMNLYTKSIAVRIVDEKTGKKLWESLTNETGWCNQILVTAPYIISLMFQNFPQEDTNVIKALRSNDPVATEIKSLFPSDTNWGCR